LIREDGSLYPPTHGRVTAAEWHPWALRLIDVIRSIHPNSLIFVSGTNWGYDLRGMPLDRANLVYSTHVYRNKGSNWAEAFPGGHTHLYSQGMGRERGRPGMGQSLVHFDALGIGWTAWSWSNEPYLVTRFTPTRFGDIVTEPGGGLHGVLMHLVENRFQRIHERPLSFYL
jgi:hypothetical protein